MLTATVHQGQSTGSITLSHKVLSPDGWWHFITAAMCFGGGKKHPGLPAQHQACSRPVGKAAQGMEREVEMGRGFLLCLNPALELAKTVTDWYLTAKTMTGTLQIRPWPASTLQLKPRLIGASQCLRACFFPSQSLAGGARALYVGGTPEGSAPLTSSALGHGGSTPQRGHWRRSSSQEMCENGETVGQC